MKPQEIGRRLHHWYVRHGRDLPWRRRRTPYRVWISEVMLQQTQIETVIPYYRKFLKRFPSVRVLAAAPLDDVLKLWEGMGYYARARNLHRAAQEIAFERGGRFPTSALEWSELPGIGAYASAAIASLTRGEKIPVIDGNVRRVVARLLDDPSPSDASLRSFLDAAIAPVPAGAFNESVMELGQRVCSLRNPECTACPVKAGCGARASGRQEEVPAPKKAVRVPHYEIAIGVCRKGDRILVSKRKAEGLLGGLWEFPGGKIERGEAAEAALAREFREEVGVEVKVGNKFVEVPHRYSHFSVRLHAFHCRWRAGRALAKECAAVRWVRPGELDRLAFPTANRKILDALQSVRVSVAARRVIRAS